MINFIIDYAAKQIMVIYDITWKMIMYDILK